MSLVLLFGCATALAAENTISAKDLARLKKAAPSTFHNAVVVFKEDLIRPGELPSDEKTRSQTEKRLFLERTRSAREKLESLVRERTARELDANPAIRWYAVQIRAAGATSFAEWAASKAPDLGVRLRLLDTVEMIGPTDDPRDVKDGVDDRGAVEFRVGYASKDKLTAILRSGAKLSSVVVKGKAIRGKASQAASESLRKAGVIGSMQPEEVSALESWMASWAVDADAARLTLKLLDSRVLEKVSGRKWKVTVLEVGNGGSCVVAGADAEALAKAAGGDASKATGIEKLQMIPDLSNPMKNP